MHDTSVFLEHGGGSTTTADEDIYEPKHANDAFPETSTDKKDQLACVKDGNSIQQGI
ncbi:hypothetical protein DPMN_149410 [Dreissena polymorpha]|uniref:Uncharacterized protein n=1 Tax=Dreissena polymorpha TaxID=45954 RepID=A0A9D4FBL9_DREPO|nr:hypothetical protein DPMN_149410 [Dreissena polymorpha]